MSATTQTRVMIVDDHSIVRDGLQEVVDGACGLEVVGQARDGAEAVEVARNVKPDVIIMDVMMPDKNGIEACREILAELPDTRVLVLTALNDQDMVVEAVAAGATGYLQKVYGREKVLATIRDVVEGEFRIPAEVIKRVFEGVRKPSEASGADELALLTPRERGILKMFAEGLSYAEIAESKGNRPVTVRNAMYRIRDKLQLKTTQQAAVWAVQHGLLEQDAP